MKVIDYCSPSSWYWRKLPDGMRLLVNPLSYIVYCKEGMLSIYLDKGFRTDGASVPFIFRFVRKKWYDKEILKNLGAITHDALYALGGEINGKKLTREECDDILRGLDRCTHATKRLCAGLVDKAVEIFAGGKKHWNNDSLDNRDKIHISWIPKFN